MRKSFRIVAIFTIFILIPLAWACGGGGGSDNSIKTTPYVLLPDKNIPIPVKNPEAGTWVGVAETSTNVLNACGANDSSVVKVTYVFNLASEQIDGIVYQVADQRSPDHTEVIIEHFNGGLVFWRADWSCGDTKGVTQADDAKCINYFQVLFTISSESPYVYIGSDGRARIDATLDGLWVADNKYANIIILKNQKTGDEDIVYSRYFYDRTTNCDENQVEERLEFFTTMMPTGFDGVGFENLHATVLDGNGNIVSDSDFTPNLFSMNNDWNLPYAVNVIVPNSSFYISDLALWEAKNHP